MGFDYGAILSFSALSGPLSPAAADLLTETLPVVEAVMLKAFAKGADE